MRESKEESPEVVLALDGAVQSANGPFEAFAGYSAAELRGMHFSGLLCSSNVGTLPQAISAVRGPAQRAAGCWRADKIPCANLKVCRRHFV